jgi:nucleotide-binding universal stress UspA family protein
MNVSLQQILVPVDFTINTEVAVQKALFLSQARKSTIHLVHVVRPVASSWLAKAGFFSPTSIKIKTLADERRSLEKLNQIEQLIRRENHSSAVIKYVVKSKLPEAAIITKAIDIKPDLILISKKSRHSLMSFLAGVKPARIALATKIPVLTFRPGSVNCDFKTIVIPLSSRFPGRKLEAIDVFKAKGLVKIRLLIFPEENKHGEISNVLVHVYRLLRQATLADIECATVSDYNRPRGILNFCKKIDADLLIVSPDMEANAGWMNKQMFDLVKPGTKTHILAI